MRDYLREINELRKERDTIHQKMSQLETERKTLRDLYGREVINPRGVGLYNTRGSVDEKIWNAHLLYWSIREEYDDLMMQYIDVKGRIDKLRDKYRLANRRTFYRPMDEIDICNLISKDGYIIGVKF